MLLKSKISKIQMLSEEWFEGRLGKFTSSEIHFLMGDKFLTTGCQSYIHRKAGEVLTGKSIKGEIDTDATRWGAAEESNAVKKFAKWAGLDFIICQQLISDDVTPFGSTPDGIIVKGESSDGLKYDVNTVEVKCPPTYTSYVGLALCETPQDLKSGCKIYYWQVLDQMLSCDCLVGYFVAYHPDFKQGNMRIIEFRKMQEVGIEYKKEVQFPIAKDMKLLAERKQMALEERDRIIQKLIEIGTI
jgi:hypothetical protein